MTYWWTCKSGTHDAPATTDNDFDTPGAEHLIGLWDFNDGAKTADTGLADGIAQNGHLHGGASISDGALQLDGSCDYFDVSGVDAPFDLASGTIMVEFTQAAQVGCDADTLVSRGEYHDRASEGYFGIQVTAAGVVQLLHYDNGQAVTLETDAGFFAPGDDVRVAYTWDEATGGTMVVENVTQGTSAELTHDVTGLTMDIGDNDDENFTFGAREADDGQYDQFFKGEINYVAVFDTDVVNEGDGIVSGTSGDDLIDYDYLGDPEGDLVDHGDALLPGEVGDDDIIEAGAGNDTVYAGAGNDEIYGDTGPDGVTTTRESFNWSELPDTDPYGSGTVDDGERLDGDTLVQNTGSVTVTVTAPAWPLDTEYDTRTINVSGIDGGEETINDNSSMYSEATGGESDGYDVTFSGPVQDVSFNITDIDANRGQVTVYAYDAEGNKVPVTLTAGSDLALSDADGINGTDTATATDGDNVSPTSASNTVNVAIAGPVTRIEIVHTNVGSGTSGINVSDIFFDAITSTGEGAGDDELYGGEGDDQIYGEDGNDTLSGGEGSDWLEGGFGSDTFTDLTAGDVVIGGEDDDDSDIDTLDLTGAGALRVIYDESDPEAGTVEFLDGVGGPVTGTLTFSEIENVIPCFTPGSLIATPKGERRVEELQVGDKVITRDNGIQEIRWVGAKTLDWKVLAGNPHLRPILIKAGSLGDGLPERDMMVSPNHRMLVASDRTTLYFEEREVLAAAKHLVNHRGVEQVDVMSATYIHFMFDQHEVVLSDGAWTESFQPGDYTLKGIGNAQRNEILELFPELASVEGLRSYTAARRILKKHEAQLLVE